MKRAGDGGQGDRGRGCGGVAEVGDHYSQGAGVKAWSASCDEEKESPCAELLPRRHLSNPHSLQVVPAALNKPAVVPLTASAGDFIPVK